MEEALNLVWKLSTVVFFETIWQLGNRIQPI